RSSVTHAGILTPREVEGLASSQLRPHNDLYVCECAVLDVDLRRSVINELAHVCLPSAFVAVPENARAASFGARVHHVSIPRQSQVDNGVAIRVSGSSR